MPSTKRGDRVLVGEARIKRHAVALLCIVAAVVARSAIAPWTGAQLPFITFYPAVALTVWYAGFQPAVSAIVLGMLAANYFFLEPRYGFGAAGEELISNSTYLVASGLIVFFGRLARDRHSRESKVSNALMQTQQYEGLADDVPAAAASLSYAALQEHDARMHAAVARERAKVERVEAALRQAEDALHRSEARERTNALELRMVLEVIPVGVFIAEDPDCYVIKMNGVGSEMIGVASDAGYTKGDGLEPYVGRHLNNGPQIRAVKLPLQRAVEGESISNWELSLATENGRPRHVSCSAAPLIDEQGAVRGAVGAFVDVTKLRIAEEALRDSDNRKHEFLAVLGHELRNPLAPLSAGLELLDQTEHRPDVSKRVYAMMDRQLTHLVRIVDDLLDVSRISRGVLELQCASLDLRAVLESAIELVTPLVAERRHEFVAKIPDMPLPVDGDFQRLTQAIGNLLVNAAKYTEPGGTVGLRAAVSEEQAAIYVTDTGFGIPSERLKNLFRMFSQVPEHKARTGGGGLGIGLALSRQLIALHGGTIEARSDGAGRGSEFVVRLPLAGSTSDPIRDSEYQRAVIIPRRVLIVDDNADAAESLRMVLELKGHKVATAYDGASALRLVESIRPEVVLLDIGLPEMNGYDVARRIREMPFGREVRLFALTGWGQEEDKAHALAAGFDEHLTKPVDSSVLSSLIGAEPMHS